jgi:hypothetical protein
MFGIIEEEARKLAHEFLTHSNRCNDRKHTKSCEILTTRIVELARRLIRMAL